MFFHISSYFFIFLHIFFIFLHISSYFLHISFIFLHNIFFIFFSYFLHASSYSFIFLHIPGTLKNSKLPPRLWDLEKFLHIELSSYIIWAPGLRQNPSYEYFIYGHETCFYCRDLDGNLNSLGLPLHSKRSSTLYFFGMGVGWKGYWWWWLGNDRSCIGLVAWFIGRLGRGTNYFPYLIE